MNSLINECRVNELKDEMYKLQEKRKILLDEAVKIESAMNKLLQQVELIKKDDARSAAQNSEAS